MMIQDGILDSHVLVVDDDAAVRHLVAESLKLHGYPVYEAANGKEAVDLALANPPKAVVLDIMMPEMDGYAVCEKLRAHPKTSRSVILILTVLSKLDDKIQGLQKGADDFITKPFEPDELAARLDAHLRRLSAQSEKETMLEKLAEKLAVMNRRLQEEAATDSLTGLFNRRYFWRRLEEELSRARRYNHPVSLLLLDLDHFKKINDQYGHPAGDRALQAVAKTLRSQVRGADLAARLGGEEFAILLPETSLSPALRVAERIGEACSLAELPGIGSGKLTASLGAAAFPQHGLEPEEIYRKADQALYRAKSTGRNRVAEPA